eukprot:5287789-Amphidinium_carterae.2
MECHGHSLCLPNNGTGTLYSPCVLRVCGARATIFEWPSAVLLCACVCVCVIGVCARVRSLSSCARVVGSVVWLRSRERVGPDKPITPSPY